MAKDSFFEKIGRSLKLEDEQYDVPMETGYSYKNNPEENYSPDSQEETNTEEAQPEDLEELEKLSEELGIAPETNDATPNQVGPVTTLAMAKSSSKESNSTKNNKINKKSSSAKNRSSSEKSAEKEKTMATKKATQTAENAVEKEEVLEEGRLTIDVYETEDHIVIKSTIAGVEPNDLDINITSDSVAIKGKRHKEEDVSAEDYFYQECYWGAFSRSVILPTEIDPDKADAKMKNGVLTIKLPKLSKAQQKKLTVKLE